MNDNIIVKVTCHKNRLVIKGPDENFVHANWVPLAPGLVGSMLRNTAEHLGVSEEALAWLKKVRRSRDAIGEVDWFEAQKGIHCFGWLGGLRAIFSDGAEGSRSYVVPEPGGYIVIPNDVPEGARKYIDKLSEE